MIELRCNFDPMPKLNKSIKKLMREDCMKRSDVRFNELTPPKLEQERTENQKFEDDVVNNIRSGIKIKHPQETYYKSFVNTVDEIARQATAEIEQKVRLDMAKNKRDSEIIAGLISDSERNLINTLANLEDDIAQIVPNLSDVVITELKKKLRLKKITVNL